MNKSGYYNLAKLQIIYQNRLPLYTVFIKMISLLLTMALGWGMGFLFRKYPAPLLSQIVQGVICLLLFFLGLELGSDRALLEEMSSIGVQAGAITAGALLGSLLMAYGIDRLFFQQWKKNSEVEQRERVKWGFLKNSAAIFASFLGGICCGGFHWLIASARTAALVLILLYALLFLVGITVGREANMFSLVRQQGYRLLLLPLGTLAGTLIGAALAGWLLPGMRLSDSMAIGSGMGYYSLSSVLISHSLGTELGSVALISNILRELVTLFFAPLLVKIFGKLAPIAAGGVTSMDITLPVVVRFSGKEYATTAVVHGAVLDPLVPVLVGMFVGM